MSDNPIPTSQAIPEAIPQPVFLKKYRAERELKEDGGKPGKTKSTWIKSTLFVAAALLAAVVGIGDFFGIGAHSDQTTEEQVAEMRRNWEIVQQTGIPLPAVKREEVPQAIAIANLSEQDKTALLRDLESESVSLVWITLWDSMDEDDDIVSVSSNGLTVTVRLSSTMQRIAIPRPSDGMVQVTGDRDGGGGITLGIMSGADMVPLPSILVGQKIDIPVR